jgi:hypothetical protein
MRIKHYDTEQEYQRAVRGEVTATPERITSRYKRTTNVLREVAFWLTVVLITLTIVALLGEVTNFTNKIIYSI